MAITIESEPTDRAPVYSDLTYVVSTTNEAQPNFRFIAVVKDGSGNIIAKLKAPILYNSTDKGVFNLSRILQNYVTYDFTLNTLQPTTCLNSYIAYSVEFGEEYGTTPAEYLNLTSDTGKWAWNGLYSIFQSQTINDYLLDDAAAKFLTNVRTRRVSRTQYDYLYFLATADTKAIHVIAYDAAGTQVASSEITCTVDAGSVTEYMGRVAAGVINLNSIAQGQLISGTAGSIVPASAAYYTIHAHDNATPPDEVSEYYRFDIVTDCSKWEPHYLYFLNSLGGFESVRCSMLSRDKYDIERKQYKRNNYRLVGGTQWLNDTTKHGMTSYSTTKKKSVTLNTNFLNEAEFEWLHELISSPVVFLDGTIPVNITDSKFEVMTYRDEPANLRIEVEYTEVERLQNA